MGFLSKDPNETWRQSDPAGGWVVYRKTEGAEPAELRSVDGGRRYVLRLDESQRIEAGPKGRGWSRETLTDLIDVGVVTFDAVEVDLLSRGRRVAAGQMELPDEGIAYLIVHGDSASVTLLRIRHGMLYPDERLLGVLMSVPEWRKRVREFAWYQGSLLRVRASARPGRVPTNEEFASTHVLLHQAQAIRDKIGLAAEVDDMDWVQELAEQLGQVFEGWTPQES